MLAARLSSPEGQQIIMIVLEPGNIQKLKEGQPIHKFLNEFMPELRTRVELMFCYSPDVAWCAEQLRNGGDATKLAEVIQESLSRPEVFVRDKTAEDLKRTL